MQWRDVNLSEHIGKPIVVVLAIHFVLWLPAFLTLQTVRVQREVVDLTAHPDPTPLGYTVSLGLWFVPLVAALAFVLLHDRRAFPWKSLGVTVGLLLFLGLVLDVAFGNLFFTFPNTTAHVDACFPGWHWESMSFECDIPIEEIFFYLFGDAVALVIYLWCDRFWLNLYSRNGNPYLYAHEGPLLRVAWWPLVLGPVLVGAAWAYKAFVAQQPGFPGYFLFLVMVAFVPAALFFTKVKERINWRAYLCTALVMFFISMLWECTIAFPYQWWAYKPEMMMGAFVAAWAGLPVEEPFLWLLVTFSSVMIFETIHAAMGSETHAGTTVLGEILRRSV